MITDQPTRAIETRRGSVECLVNGTGPAVLCLHGAMGGYDQAVTLAKAALGNEPFQTIAVSRPGYLGTPLSRGKTPEEQADLCADILTALGIAQAAVIAVSGGGQCALQFALRHRERCRALVMISACSAPIPVGIPLRFRLIQLAARLPFFVAKIRKSAEQNPDNATRFAIPEPALRNRTLADPEAGPLLRRNNLSVFDGMSDRLPGTRNDIEQSRRPFDYPLEQLAVPLLAIHGTADRVAPYSAGRDLAARVPGAEWMSIEGGEHAVLFTHLAEIRARVRQFLQRHSLE